MITEGLLMYLERAAVEALAAGAARHGIRRWLLDAVRSNGWSQLCFRSYSRDAAEVAAGRITAMLRPYLEKGIPVPAAPVGDLSGVYLFGRE
jgi:O-methyltransferase involved in polyketide biosynthesis